jgi:hypothetical protein
MLQVDALLKTLELQESAQYKGHFTLFNCLVLGHIKYNVDVQRVYCNPFPTAGENVLWKSTLETYDDPGNGNYVYYTYYINYYNCVYYISYMLYVNYAYYIYYCNSCYPPSSQVGLPSSQVKAKAVSRQIWSGRHGFNSCHPQHEACFVLSTKQCACLY